MPLTLLPAPPLPEFKKLSTPLPCIQILAACKYLIANVKVRKFQKHISTLFSFPPKTNVSLFLILPYVVHFF